MGKTILLVSHDLSSIAKYCDKVILLDKGTKIDEGSPKKIIDLYKKALVNQLKGKESEDEGKEAESIGQGESWKQYLRMNPKQVEYGNREAEILDFAIIDSSGKLTDTIEKGVEFTIKCKVRFAQVLEQPIVAFTIKDLKGTEICGTNTMYEKCNIENVEAGKEIVVIFTQKADIQGGEYLLSLGCTGYIQGEFTVFHRLYDVCNMTVISDKNTVGFYDMNSEVSILYK